VKTNNDNISFCMQQDTWFTTSLFCTKNNWGNVLAAVQLFLSEENANNHIKAFTVEFNYMSGENIRFALFISTKKAVDLARHTDRWFKNYFATTNFTIPEPALPLPGIFMPFPEKTIQYGLYKVVINNLPEEKVEDSLPCSISRTIVHALKDEDIDDQLILTFAYYLLLGLIKTIVKSSQISITEFYQSYIDNKNAPGVGGNDNMSGIISGNKDQLLQITDSIFNPQTQDDIPFWLDQWMNLCEREIRNQAVHTNTNAGEAAFRGIVYQVYKHLGINSKMGSLLTSFLKLAFDERILTGVCCNNKALQNE
jgi:hypothetical protein